MIVHTRRLDSDRTLHHFRGRASNQYILEDLGDGSTYLVDCGMPSDAPGHGEVTPFDYRALPD